MNNLMLIVVVYNTKISDLYFIKEHEKDNSSIIDIFIYDNSIDEQDIPEIKNVNFYYIHDDSNSGVSRGYNIGIQKAKELDKKCVILLDQDSIISFSDFKQYILLYNKYGDKYLYTPIMYSADKIYSPGFINNFAGKVQNTKEFIYEEVYSLMDKSLINSGLMIPLKLIDIIGTFNEKIKLDFSDYYFIEKYKKYRDEVIVLDLYIEHSLSGDESKNYLEEMQRYKYYCNGAKEFNNSLVKSMLYPVLRRMLILILKYKSLKPVSIFINYFIGRRII